MTTLGKLSPSITKMIRLDHTHVLTNFHGYTVDATPTRKKAIVEIICLALDIHAQLEEEVFYPALRDAAPDNDVLAKSKPEHDEMRAVIARLRGMSPQDSGYDDAVFELMRDVMHHVADEETVLLPLAEKLLAARLGELGARMTRRRLVLVRPHTGQIAINQAKAMPLATALIAGGAVAAAGLLLKRSLGSSSGTSRWH